MVDGSDKDRDLEGEEKVVFCDLWCFCGVVGTWILVGLVVMRWLLVVQTVSERCSHGSLADHGGLGFCGYGGFVKLAVDCEFC